MKKKSVKIPTNEPPICGLAPKGIPASDLNIKIACATIRIAEGKASIASEISHKGVAGVELGKDTLLVVTLEEQPAGRPLVLCQDGFVIHGEEYREFRISLNPVLELDRTVTFVAVYQ